MHQKHLWPSNHREERICHPNARLLNRKDAICCKGRFAKMSFGVKARSAPIFESSHLHIKIALQLKLIVFPSASKKVNRAIALTIG